MLNIRSNWMVVLDGRWVAQEVIAAHSSAWL